MYIVVIAWMYVAIMMAVAEATHSQGSLLGAIVTFVMYGLVPIGLVIYIMRTPARRQARQQALDAELRQTQSRTEAQTARPEPLNTPD